MNKKALLQQVQAATPEEQKLIEQILTTPNPLKLTLLKTLSEIAKPTQRSQFLQYVLGTALAVSQEQMIATLGFESMVEAFTDTVGETFLNTLKALKLRRTPAESD